MQTASEIVRKMLDAVPAGRNSLEDAESRRLSLLTQSLLASRPEAQREYCRYLATCRRSIGLPGHELERLLRDKTILVTGGTGCIGSELMMHLARLSPRRLVSVSRGAARPTRRLPGAEYVCADIRDAKRLAAVFNDVRCDVVFHVAGQRDPGLAEREVHRTVTTNVFGTRNVIRAADGVGVPHVVCASTGKALRPYSADVYTASKRAAEWLLVRAAAEGAAAYSAVRFTHVVDNSIIHARLLRWSEGGVIRLHGADIAFYVQSALESAQLLLGAGVGGQPGTVRVHAITDLGWPVSLLDLALGVLAWTGSAAPIYFCGHDRGYEAVPFPGLYDPITAGDVSPLISAFEAPLADPSPCPAADAFRLEVARLPELDRRLQEVEDMCARTEEPGPLREALDGLSLALLDASMQAAPPQTLVRAARLTASHRDNLSAVHERTLAAIERHAAVNESSPVSTRQACRPDMSRMTAEAGLA